MTVEPPRIPVAEAYGGIGWRDIANPNGAVIVLIPQNPYLKVGDTLTLYWGDASRPVDTHVLTQDDLLGNVSMRVPVSDVVNTGDGPIKVWYVAFMDQPVTSPATTVTVKTTVPGGLDPDPVDTPYRNEDLLAPTVSPNIVDATQAQNGVTVTVPLWENMAAGDKLRVRWGTESVYHAPLLLGEVGAPVVVTIDQQTILAAGDSAKLMVSYDITDVVSQWSNNSMPAYAQVDVGNAIFDAPYVVEASGGVLDVDKLGNKDATVLITVKAPIAVGDTIHLIFDGQSNAGLPVREESDAPVAVGDQFVHMAIGHSALAQVAPGTASLYYRVKRNGVDQGRSQSTFLNIAGTASTLAAPTVLEARGNTLDPQDTPNGAHVQIAPWSGMAVGDEVLLYWNGTAANGRPLAYMDDATIAVGGVNTPVTFTVPPEYVVQIAGGSVDVYYVVKQGTAQRQSQHLQLSVVGQILLPAQLVQGVVAGVLDPA